MQRGRRSGRARPRRTFFGPGPTPSTGLWRRPTVSSPPSPGRRFSPPDIDNTTVRSGGDNVGQKETKAANESAAPPRLEEVLLRAAAGDRSVLPRLRELLRAPLLTELLGNLARHAQQVIINGLCGTDLATREGLEKKMAELRSEVGGRGT